MVITPTSAAAHVFVESDLRQPHLGDQDRHHLTRVLRLRPGSAVTASDGRGGWVPCRLGGNGALEPADEVVHEPPSGPRLTVAFALTKGERPDLVVQKLTELGVDQIVPFVAERSVVRWDEAKAAKHHARFVELTRQASMQSRRVTLPSVGLTALPSVGFTAPTSGELTQLLPTFGQVAAALASGVVMADRTGRPLAAADTTTLIGPEGGWSPQEHEAGLPRIGLGETVLRAETAAITAGALMVALRSDMVSAAVDNRDEI